MQGSKLARQHGKHRNTIHRQLRKIREAKCPVEIVTVRNQIEQIAKSQTASLLEVLRARIVLAFLNGLTSAETAQHLGTSVPTVTRWRSRFRLNGLGGLRTNNRGKAVSPSRDRLVEWLRNTGNPDHLSLRVLAVRFGLSKSTVQTVLKMEMVHKPPETTL